MDLNLKDVLEKPEYSFIDQSKVMFLTLGGSYAYGTNIETSDIDVRGIMFNRKSDLLGLTSFDKPIEDRNTDTVIYGFNKAIELFTKCNPNAIEMLGTRPQDRYICHPLGQELVDNVDLFLSQKAFKSFSGYAKDQLRRLENALVRKDNVENSLRNKHILGSIENIIFRHDAQYKMHVSFDENDELIIESDNMNFNDLHTIMGEIKATNDSYGKLNHRNNKKDDFHIDKHAMHLVRLQLMARDIAKHKKVITYREEDSALLHSIRRGDYRGSDGMYIPEFFEMLNTLKKELENAIKHTDLQVSPNMKKIEEFVMYVNEETVKM